MAPEPVAPIFILADDDREAVDRALQRLPDAWTYVTVTQPRSVVKYAREINVTAIFLAAEIRSAAGGSARLLQDLIDAVGKPVVILAESWSPEVAERWKRMGASDCIPHPSRMDERFETLRSKLQDLALAQVRMRRLERRATEETST